MFPVFLKRGLKHHAHATARTFSVLQTPSFTKRSICNNLSYNVCNTSHTITNRHSHNNKICQFSIRHSSSSGDDINEMSDKSLTGFMHSNTVDVLRNIRHPKQQDFDIVYLGLIRNINIKPDANNALPNRDKKVIISIELELSESYREIKQLIQQTLQSSTINPYSSVISSVRVNMAPAITQEEEKEKEEKEQSQNSNGKKRQGGLKNVSNIIAVSSCKGGVGKSTIAVNLAYTLSRMDYKVGIFDSDIFGPSLPTMISSYDSTVRQSDATNMLIPIRYEGVSSMSFGYVKTNTAGSDSKTGLAIMRGPMVTQVVSQLILTTDWGNLDYLIIDMPPGTGDIHLTLSQNLNIDAAIVISTPSKLSYIDVIKGISMFDKVKIPTISVIENMTHFECESESCNHINIPFGKGYKDSFINEFGIKNTYQLPMNKYLSFSSDNGDPLMLQDAYSIPDINEKEAKNIKEIQNIFEEIAQGCVNEMEILNNEEIRKANHPTFGIDKSEKQVMFKWSNDLEIKVPFVDLRLACQCAVCVDEFTHEIKIKKEHLGNIDDLNVDLIQECGNYAVRIEWNHKKHESLYSFEKIKKLWGK